MGYHVEETSWEITDDETDEHIGDVHKVWNFETDSYVYIPRIHGDPSFTENTGLINLQGAIDFIMANQPV